MTQPRSRYVRATRRGCSFARWTKRTVRISARSIEDFNSANRLKGELERANKLEHTKRLGVLHAVILGPDELARGEAIVRELGSGAQRTVELSGLVDELLALGGRA